MVLVPAGGARRRDAPAGTPATPAAALCGRLFRLISSENGVENIRWHTNVFADAERCCTSTRGSSFVNLSKITLFEHNVTSTSAKLRTKLLLPFCTLILEHDNLLLR